MDLIDDIIAAARRASPHVVLAEGEDPRIVEAAIRAARDGLAQISVVADPAKFAALAARDGAADRLTVCDPHHSSRRADYAHAYYELRKHKGVTEEAAEAAMQSNLGFAAMMVRQGDADGTIGGAVATTADTVRAALQIVGKAPGVKTVSSFFLMVPCAPVTGPLVFADCALVVEPSAEELASIAISSADSFRAMTGEEPRVAMLAFSTLGSASHPSLDVVREAVGIARDAAPGLMLDGEIQFDAAFVPAVGDRKAPESPLAGTANVFVFPNLHAANIGYKIAQRIGGAVALGPVLQGLTKPANDLSRGCSTEDVYKMIAITGAQAAAQFRASDPGATRSPS